MELVQNSKGLLQNWNTQKRTASKSTGSGFVSTPGNIFAWLFLEKLYLQQALVANRFTKTCQPMSYFGILMTLFGKGGMPVNPTKA